MPATEPITIPATAPPDMVLGQAAVARGLRRASVLVLVLVMGA